VLTRDLLRVSVKKGDIRPSWIDTDSPKLVETAQSLVETWSDAAEESWSRSQLTSWVNDLVGDRRDHKLVRGLAKLMSDKSEFEVSSPIEPKELRQRVFSLAAERGPLAMTEGPFGHPTAKAILAEIAAELEVSAEEVAAALYADLKEAQKLISAPSYTAEKLLRRYNVALVQALLLHATKVSIQLRQPSPVRMRQLFRYIKFHQLIHSAKRAGPMLDIELDGPTSLFKQSSRYGMQLANFFSALLLQECPWEMEATVLWTRARHRRTLRVSSEDGLRSHLRDTGAYRTRAQQWFEERFAALDSPWTLSDGDTPIELGGRGVVWPDYRFERDGRVGYLEIVGYWRPERLERHLELLERYGPGNVIVAISKRLRATKEDADLGEHVIGFAEIIPAKKVVNALESIAL